MSNWGNVEIGTIATISTAHIPEDALNLLNAVYENKTQEIEDPTHWINSLTWASFPYGYLVSGYNLKDKAQKNELPPFLEDAARLATELDLAWLVYDQDAGEIDGIKNYYEDDD